MDQKRLCGQPKRFKISVPKRRAPQRAARRRPTSLHFSFFCLHRALVPNMLGTSVLLLAGAAAALDCHAQFWPEMHASPRRLDALILANGALAKLCFDADADGEVHRQHARVFLNASGLVDISIESDLQDVLKKTTPSRRSSRFYSRRSSGGGPRPFRPGCGSKTSTPGLGPRCGPTSRSTSCP